MQDEAAAPARSWLIEAIPWVLGCAFLGLVATTIWMYPRWRSAKYAEQLIAVMGSGDEAKVRPALRDTISMTPEALKRYNRRFAEKLLAVLDSSEPKKIVYAQQTLWIISPKTLEDYRSAFVDRYKNHLGTGKDEHLRYNALEMLIWFKAENEYVEAMRSPDANLRGTAALLAHKFPTGKVAAQLLLSVRDMSDWSCSRLYQGESGVMEDWRPSKDILVTLGYLPVHTAKVGALAHSSLLVLARTEEGRRALRAATGRDLGNSAGLWVESFGGWPPYDEVEPSPKPTKAEARRLTTDSEGGAR